jgi:hypothetical protein
MFLILQDKFRQAAAEFGCDARPDGAGLPDSSTLGCLFHRARQSFSIEKSVLDPECRAVLLLAFNPSTDTRTVNCALLFESGDRLPLLRGVYGENDSVRSPLQYFLDDVWFQVDFVNGKLSEALQVYAE